ncbi:O-antigen ligase family protein [Clostridium cellulovorans]|uniref:O-antigen polymerase n=1 Tax=Clostridium cellulovorans (strain ATCC 35296 / DSM 3052 / OCM 3 / 743B) TaxID=573061 RepID=D9SMZ4_CLOC7|nr:O-antigen ligase family protein [Clostridium cellulovorans]ADL51860.1 O-antigen polymerase [Clostridium cellulovorans 743B]
MNTNWFMMLFGIYLTIFPLFPSAINRKTLFTEFFMLILMIIYLAINLKSKDKKIQFIKNLKEFFTDKLSITLLVLLGFMLISISYSTDLILVLKDSMRFIVALGIFFIVRFEIKSKKSLDNLIKLIYIPAFIEFTYGIIQYITGWGLIFHTGDIARIEGNVGHPNTLAGYAVLLFFPLFFIMVNEKKKKWKIFYAVELLLLVVNIVLTFSRNSWLALVLGILILCIYYSWKFLIPLGIGGIIALSISTIRLRLTQFVDPNINSGRIKIWTLTLKCFKEHPILGVGAGNYEAVHKSYVARYPQYDPGEQIYHTHNVYLKMLSELGIVGFVTYVVGAFFILKKIFTVHNKLSGYYKDLMGGILISFITAYFVINMFDNVMVLPQIMNYFYLFLGIVYVIERLNKNA